MNSINKGITIKQCQNMVNTNYQSNFGKNNATQKDSDKNEKNHCARIALVAFICAVVPVIILNACKKGRLNNLINSFKNKMPAKDKFKAIWNLLEIDNYDQILATTTGGVAGGLFEGLKYSKTKEEKEAKYKEGIFEFLNNMTPTTIVALGTSYAKKTGKMKSAPAKALFILSSVASGMFIANKASNKINQTIFDKDKPEKETRNFKLLDCFVHIDDLVNIAVLTKIPLASKFQIGKLLPFIYARSGFEVAMAKPKEHKEH